MEKSKAIKVITLIHFIGFIVLFIFFQTGKINEIKLSEDTYLQLSPSGGVINNSNQTNVADTSRKKKTIVLPSSKSAPVFTNPISTKNASPLKLKFDSLGNILYDSTSMRRMMSSSKSIILFEKVVIKDTTYYKIKKKQ